MSEVYGGQRLCECCEQIEIGGRDDADIMRATVVAICRALGWEGE